MGKYSRKWNIDFQKALKEAWGSFAIQGQMAAALPEILPKLIQTDLHSLAANFGIDQPSELKEEEIIARLLKLMAEEEKIAEILTIARDYEFGLFLKLLDMDWMEIDDMPYESYAYLMEYGVIFSFYYRQKRYLLVCEEIKGIYGNINKPWFRSRRKRYQLVYKYIKGLCILYGAFEPKQFINIFNRFNRQRISLTEFRKICSRLYSRPQDFLMHGEYALEKYFMHTGYQELEDFVEMVEEKPYYYMPGKEEEILNRADSLYFEMTPQLTALRDYILKKMVRDEKIADSLIGDIDFLSYAEMPFCRLIYEFKRHGILFESTKQLKIIMSLLADVYNNTRTWSKRGYTATEMNETLKKGVSLATPIPIEKLEDGIFKKVGRNQPCPCGSGKKYKKCCGR
ncbi:MAG: YecA family protein [Actinomycetota bacterium]